MLSDALSEKELSTSTGKMQLKTFTTKYNLILIIHPEFNAYRKF